MADRYRVGRKLGRTIYRDDQLIGMMDYPNDAGMIVNALNTAETFRPVRDRMNDLRRELGQLAGDSHQRLQVEAIELRARLARVVELVDEWAGDNTVFEHADAALHLREALDKDGTH